MIILNNKGNNNENITEQNIPIDTELHSDFSSDDSILDPTFMIEEMPEEEDLSLLGKQVEYLLNSSISSEKTTEIGNKRESQTVRKRKRNLGISYINKTGEVSARQFIPLSINCRNNCKSKILVVEQKKMFENYWKLGSYNRRVQAIASLMTIEETKMLTKVKNKNKPRNRPYHFRYHLEIAGKQIQVCQRCFKQSFAETDSFLKSVAKKKIAYPNIEMKDLRGGTGMKEITDTVVEKVKSHINLFPAYESHYTRKRTSLKYFHANLTITKMYNLFLEMHPEIKISISKYTNIFKSK